MSFVEVFFFHDLEVLLHFLLETSKSEMLVQLDSFCCILSFLLQSDFACFLSWSHIFYSLTQGFEAKFSDMQLTVHPIFNVYRSFFSSAYLESEPVGFQAI